MSIHLQQAALQDDPESKEEKAYELQVYSLEGVSFGEVIASRPIKAAHCLTAIQFSPGSRHIMLAYGRCASHKKMCTFLNNLE